jgi:serine protease AprX
MQSLVKMTLLGLGFSLALNVWMAGPIDASEPVKVWVRFKDKGPASRGLAPTTRAYEDLPIFTGYVDRLQGLGFTRDTQLKWQNLVSGFVDPTQIIQLREAPFVTEVSLLPRKAKPDSPRPRWALAWPSLGLGKTSALGLDYGAGRSLMESLHVDKVHAWMTNSGLQLGRAVRIAVIDADFHLGSPIFKDLFIQNRILDQWDFVSNKPIAVQKDLVPNSHGGECLSTIVGNLPGTLVGVAPEASVLLYRAEENDHEGFVEEDYVAAAIERAVDSGASIISISLGYRYEYDDGHADLPFASMDGKTRPSSIAATGAARRNVLVSVAMGNLPASDHIPNGPSISAPADADSILAVGIGDASRSRCSYSCTGPSADGRIKPDISSLGLVGGCAVAVAHTGQAIGSVEGLQGTSFAAPVVAGIAVLLRQLRPDLSAEAIRQALIATADRVAKPDSGLGYGVLDAWSAFLKIQGDTLAHASPQGWIRLYHAGGLNPLFIPRNSLDSKPNLQLLDLGGRRIAVTVQIYGPTLWIQPQHELRTGVYLARIR